MDERDGALRTLVASIALALAVVCLLSIIYFLYKQTSNISAVSQLALFCLISLVLFVSIEERSLLHYTDLWNLIPGLSNTQIFRSEKDSKRTTGDDSFSRLVDKVKTESKYTSEVMHEVRISSNGSSPFVSLGTVAMRGLDAGPVGDFIDIDEMLDDIQRFKQTKEYLDSNGDEKLRVVKIRDESVTIRTDDLETKLRKDIFFRVYELSEREGTDIPNEFCVASVDHIYPSHELATLSVLSWNTLLESSRLDQLRQGDLDGKRIRASVLNVDSIRETDIDMIEELEESLGRYS